MAGRRAPSRIPTVFAQTPKVADANTQRAFDVLSAAVLDLQARRYLDLFTAEDPGYVPASGGSSSDFLRADGVWAPPGGGGAVSSVTAGSSAVTASPTTGAVVIDVVPANFTGIPESGVTNLVSDLGLKALKATTITAGTGLSGGGTLAADRTISLANTAVTPAAYTYASITVDAQGRLTAAASGATPALASRLISTTAPLAGGGDLSADRTLTVATFGTSASGVVPASGGGTANFLRADGSWHAPPGTVSLPILESDVTGLTTDLAAKALGATTITAGTGLSGGGDLSTNRTISLANTAVSAASYTYASITVDAQGRLTAASSGTAPAVATRNINTGTGLSGGGDLSADRTIALANTAVTPAAYTYASITVDAQGRLTAAASGATPATAGRLINTTAPITGGGDLSADRTIAITAFAGSTPGSVPTSVGGTVNFLRADGAWSPPVGGNDVGIFGPGTDGNLVFDGSATILGMAPSSSVYTFTRDVYANNCTLSSGSIRLKTNGYQLFVAGTLTTTTGSGQIDDNGAPGTIGGGGASRSAGWYSANAAGGGGTGGASANALGNPFVTSAISVTGGADDTHAGSTGGTCQGGSGGGSKTTGGVAAAGFGSGAITATGAASFNLLQALLLGRVAPALTTALSYGSGGGAGGGGGATVCSGGAAGGIAYVVAKIIGTITISADGGAGAGGSVGGLNASSSGGGGGGGAGYCFVTYRTCTGTLTATAAGGTGGAAGSGATGTGHNGAKGGDGGSGFVWKLNTSGDGT